MSADARDEAMDRWLRRSFESNDLGDVTPECLDAEAFAAWIDGGLRGTALQMTEAHVAGCSRCQAMAAAMMRSAPEAAVVAPWWRRSLRSAWLIPLTAGATAVLVWSVVPNRPTRAPEPLVAVGAPAEPPSIDTKAAPQPTLADRVDAPSEALKDFAAKKPAAENAQRQSKLRKADDLSRVERQPQEADKRVATVQGRDSGRVGAKAEAAIPPPAPVAAIGGASPPPPSPSAEASQPVPARSGLAAAMKQQSFTREIPSTDPAIRWRIGAGGLIERTEDSGKTWTRQSSGVIADLIAGSSRSATICWVVGRDSTVLLTTDGRTWGRVNIPEVADLVAIDAVDASTAVVTSSDGRKFRTTSAGRTWSELPKN